MKLTEFALEQFAANLVHKSARYADILLGSLVDNFGDWNLKGHRNPC